MARKKKQPEDEIEIEIVSKSELKREMTRLQGIGNRLLELSPEKLKEFPLEETLLSALLESQRLKSHEAKRRQLQYIGRLMRDADEDAIVKALDFQDPGSEVHLQLTMLSERWRRELLEDPDATARFFEAYPDVERQPMRQLIRNAQQEAKQHADSDQNTNTQFKHRRKLFQAIRDEILPSL